MKTKTGIISLLAVVNLLYVFSSALPAADYQIPATVGTVYGSDYSAWEQVCDPGFGNDNNIAFVAMAEYQGRLYVMTGTTLKVLRYGAPRGNHGNWFSFPTVLKTASMAAPGSIITWAP